MESKKLSFFQTFYEINKNDEGFFSKDRNDASVQINYRKKEFMNLN